MNKSIIASQLEVSNTIPILIDGEHMKAMNFNAVDQHSKKKRVEQMVAA